MGTWKISENKKISRTFFSFFSFTIKVQIVSDQFHKFPFISSNDYPQHLK